MRKSSIELTINNFILSIKWYVSLINKIIEDNSFFEDREDKTEILEAFVLKICARWEILVETLLIDCLNIDSTKYADFMGLSFPKHLPRNQCQSMILGLGYLDFKGVSDIKKKAKNILVPTCNPFKEIPNNHGNKIDEFYRMRNYLAHYSSTAERSMRNLLINTYRMKRFREPGDFLMSIDKRTRKPRIINYTMAFYNAVFSMAEFFGFEKDT